MNATAYKTRTPQAVIDVLERARENGTRIRLFVGDTETGEAWPEEYQVSGTVGRSTGSIKIPLLICNARSTGGMQILTDCIVAIMTGPNRFLYKHPKFSTGKWSVGPSDLPDYRESAFHNGSVHARFKKDGQAARYVAFMTGERLSK